MAELSMTGCGYVQQTVSLITREMQQSAVSCQLVGSTSRLCADTQIHVLVFEKYYWRTSNRASLTVVVSGEDGNVCVDAISSGGGRGVFFRFSWGAETSFTGAIERILLDCGFTRA